MRRLDAGGDPQGPKPGHVGPVDQFDMLDPVAQVRPSRRLIAVDGLAHRRVADRVDRDLQVAARDFLTDGLEAVRLEQGKPRSVVPG